MLVFTSRPCPDAQARRVSGEEGAAHVPPSLLRYPRRQYVWDYWQGRNASPLVFHGPGGAMGLADSLGVCAPTIEAPISLVQAGALFPLAPAMTVSRRRIVIELLRELPSTRIHHPFFYPLPPHHPI